MKSIKIPKTASSLFVGVLFVLLLIVTAFSSQVEGKSQQNEISNQAVAMDYSPQKNNQRKVSLQLKNATLSSALHKLSRVADVGISFDYEDIPAKNITYTCNKKAFYTVLRDLLADTNLVFTLSDDKKVVIVRDADNLQTGSITGQVTDAQTGDPLPGANITILGTSHGASADVEGRFTIEDIKAGEYMLRASFVGYKTVKKQITIQENEVTIINLSLEPATGRLDEMVVVGYGETQRRDLTGSVGTIGSEEIQEVNIQTIDQALKGKMSGVYVSSASGRPGDGAIVHVRGLSQLRGSNEPLYVVDGVPIVKNPNGFDGTDTNPLVGINPDNIERIDVLKDASAAAIYGSRAANGVVLITTKEGRRDGSTNVDFSMSTSIQNPVKTYDVLSAEEYKDHATRIAQNQLDSSPLPPSLNQPYYHIVNNPDQFFGDADTDWQDLITNDNALLTEYRATISGDSRDVSYRVSGQMSSQEGIMINNEFNRYSVSPRIDANITDRLSAGASLNYNYIVDKSSAITNLSDGAFFRPDLPVRRDDGSFTTIPAFGGLLGSGVVVRNPIGGQAKVSNESLTNNLYGSAFAEFEIIDNLSIKSEVNMSLSNEDVSNFAPSFSDQVIFNILNNGTAEATRTERYNKRLSTVFSNTLNYSGTFAENHNIDAVLGVSWDRSSYDNESQTYRGFPDDNELTEINSASRVDSYNSQTIESGLNSVFGRVNYNFDDRYLLTFTVRRDGSTKFGPNNRYGTFPSGAIAWNLHNERFMQNIGPVSQLKLRASLGQTGSDNLPSFSFLQYAGTGYFYGNNNGFTLTDFPNPDIKWEETTQLDVGLEFGLFDDRLNGEIVYFEKNTSDIILFTPLPSETGFSRYQTNLADVSNDGLEVQLGGYVIRNTDFAWNSSFNVSFVNNNVDDLAGGSTLSGGSSPSIQEGSPIGIITGYEVVKIAQDQEEIDELNDGAPDGQYHSALQQPGDYIYEDLDNDGQITAEDQKVLGDINPDYFGGWSNSLFYKDFEFSFAFNFVQGNQRYYGPLGAGEFNSSVVHSNASTLIYETWTPNNRDAYYARLGGDNTTQNSRTVQDGSYIRLRSASLGYNLPQEWTSSVGIRDAKITLRGTNLLTFSDYDGIDPESVNSNPGGATVGLTRDQGGFYPMARTFTLELNLGF